MHFGVPHRFDGGRDDIQMLYTSSAMYRQYYSGVNDGGQQLANGLLAQCDFSHCAPPHWPDYYTFPGGTQFLSPANVQPIAYLFPGSPTQSLRERQRRSRRLPRRHLRTSSQRLSRRPLGYG